MSYVYVLVRRDLSPEQQAVQAIHAAIDAARSHLIAPDVTHPHLALCGVADEFGLLQQALRLDANNVKYSLFREPDRDNEATALATEPLTGEYRRLFRKFQLLSLQGVV